MMVTQKPATMKRTGLRSAARQNGVAPSASRVSTQLRAQKQEEHVAATGRRDFLSLLGLLTGLSAASAAQAADPYEELKALSAARTGSSSLLESFEATKGAVSSSKASRGIREKLAAEAAPPAKSSGGLFGSKAVSFTAPTPKPKAAAPAPKPKPAAPAAASAAGSSGAGFAAGPLVQAAGVLGLVGVGASVATSAATSKPKDKPAAAASAAPSRAATPSLARSESRTGKVQAGGTGKVTASRPATPVSKSATGKVTAGRPATPAAKSSTGKVLAGAAAARSGSAKVTKAAAAAAASGSTMKTVVKQALVNDEDPNQPTDFATGGFLGLVGVLAAFLLFGLPKPTVVPPTTTSVSDPLVEEARKAAGLTSSTYTTPLFKAAGEAEETGRKAIYTAPKLAAEAPKPAAPAKVAPVLPPKPAAPAVVEAPKPAAPVVTAPKVAEAPKPAAVVKAEAPKPAAPAPAAAVKAQEPAAAAATDGPSAAQNLLVVAGGIAVVVTAFALTGSSSDSSSSEGSNAAATSTPAAAGASGSDSAAAAVSAAETVSAAASAAAATAPTEGAQQGNAAYDKAVMALMADPEVTQDLFSVMSADDAALRNIPALSWALISTPSNAERLDGFAFQKLSKQRYDRVRQLLLDAGLQLPDSPIVQAGAAIKLAPAGDVDSREVDPEKLRGVFEALLANEASRGLMRQLLKGAGMPFNEEAFEEQVKDSTYFNLAIAPILRSMPQQKLRVLAELQDPEKLQQLVASVSLLAADDKQLQAVTAELSTDVKQTVNTIRQAEEQAASGTSSSSR